LTKPDRCIDVTQVSEWQEGKSRRFLDYLVAEEPLEIRVGGEPLAVTMRTPGHDRELVAGFLCTEGIIQSRDQITFLREDIDKSQSSNVVDVELTGTDCAPSNARRNFFSGSGCGICGKTSIDAIRARGIRAPNQNFRLDAELLCTLPDKLRSSQAVFGRTGGLHAAGLFSATGELIATREDVGRHNAVDKIVGWALLEGRLPLSQCLLVVSGRGGFEIIQKVLVAGIPLLASVSAPSGLAVRLAREFGLTLIGFLRGRRFLVYSGEERMVTARPRATHADQVRRHP